MKNFKGLKAIIILGPPGSGKGTQAELLSDNLGLYHFETSKIIEESFNNAKKGDFIKIENKKYFLEDERKLREGGKVMSPPLISFWVQKNIKELKKQGKGVVISGSPRTIYEAKEIFPIFRKLYGKNNIAVVAIELRAKESILRNSHRRICQLMRHSILYSKESSKLKTCPIDGSKLTKRGRLDMPNVIKIRLEEYKEMTFPIIEFAKKQGFHVIKINGEKPVAKVFQSILRNLK